MAEDTAPYPKTAFTDLLHELRAGDAMTDASETLAKLIHDIQSVGKRGSLTLTLTIEPVTKGNTTTLVVVDEIKVKPPKIDEGSTIVFANEKGQLSRRDPRQPELPMERALADVRDFSRRSAVNEHKE